MLPFARRELVVCMDLNQCDSVCAALDQAKIPYTVKSRDRSSPSVFAMGTRLLDLYRLRQAPGLGGGPGSAPPPRPVVPRRASSLSLFRACSRSSDRGAPYFSRRCPHVASATLWLA